MLLQRAKQSTCVKCRWKTSSFPEKSRIVVHLDPNSPGTDRFRFLRMRLRELQNTNGMKRLLVSSPLPGDGKSAVAMNLATVLAERGDRSVLLIDADLHHSSVGDRLGLKSRAGLAECLSGTDPASALVRIEPLGWYLLPAGTPPDHPTELLQSDALGKLMQQLTSHFDWIVIDSPPVLPITDALTLARQANGTLLIARAGLTSVDAIKKAVALLSPQHVIGIVLNGVEEDTQRLYSNYHGYYPAPRRKAAK